LKLSLVTGRQPVIEAMRAGKVIERIYLQRNATGEAIHSIKVLARQLNIPVNEVPVEKLNSLSRSNHQGCIAVGGKIRYIDLQDVISFSVEKGEVPLLLLLDSITDVRNIGAIARTALCCGVHAIIIPDKGTAPLNEEAIKASAGALESVHVCRVSHLSKAIDICHLNGIKVYASQMRTTKMLYQCDFTEPCAIVMGAEDNGIHPGLLKVADEYFTIPMAGNFDSFNVSVASGIILYEVMKQRISAIS
jgi:23S rRNA (guanosine2251-2'-O)-methyltransferase